MKTGSAPAQPRPPHRPRLLSTLVPFSGEGFRRGPRRELEDAALFKDHEFLGFSCASSEGHRVVSLRSVSCKKPRSVELPFSKSPPCDPRETRLPKRSLGRIVMSLPALQTRVGVSRWTRAQLSFPEPLHGSPHGRAASPTHHPGCDPPPPASRGQTLRDPRGLQRWPLLPLFPHR